MRRPGASQLSRFHGAASLLLLAVLVAPGAHASDEPSQMRAVVEASVSRGTVLGRPWAPRTAYSASLWGLWQAGQGVGARVSLLPASPSAAAWELSTDAVARFTGEGPLYFKALGGAALAPRLLWPPRLRVGAEAGVHAIRGSVGLELGLAGVYAFPPSHFAQGQGMVSLGVGLLFGFSAPSQTPVLAPPQLPWAQQPTRLPRGALQQQSPTLSSAAEGSTAGLSSAASEGPGTSSGGRDVIQQILLLQQPADVQSWWDSGPSGEQFQQWTHPLSQWELKYCQAMSAETVPEPIRMWPLVTPQNLTPKQTEDMERRLGPGAGAEGYCHWENRRRIVKHYYMTHPATLQYLLSLYGLARDINPLNFALERGWQMGSGQELFTSREVSRLDAAQEFFSALAVGVATGRLMTATRPVPGWGVPEPIEPVGPGRVLPPRAPPRAVEPAPELVPAPAPEPIPAPPPAPGPLAPSPELVQALTGNNPTPRVPAVPRLPQDTAVKPKVPGLRKTDRPISPSPRQNAQLQRDIQYLERELGARNIRVNQQQLNLENKARVGINRPDLQFDYEGRRYHVEYDSPTSGRGPGHQSRLTANDPEGEVILIIIPVE